LTHFVHNIAKETGELLKDMGNLQPSYQQTEQRQQKLLKEKLVNQFSEALDRFQKAQRLAAQKERESFVRARAHSATNHNQSQWVSPFLFYFLFSGKSLFFCSFLLESIRRQRWKWQRPNVWTVS
jgi:Syntaxin-like protein